VYGGGKIIARLDANGDPLYYLTDSMGSVIGLVDASGNIQSRIIYDGFGNVISGDDGSSLGGDFRFQGQWLESESGLYYMRARDYDAETGLFLSRDPVDVQDQDVAAFNPYQFAFNNPLVYSDPTGMFSIIEMNATINTQNVLNSFRTYSVNAAKQKLTDTLYEALGNVALNAISNFVPGAGIPTILIQDAIGAGNWFESTLRKTTCEVLKFGNDQLFFEPGVTSRGGNAITPGFNCSIYQKSPSDITAAIEANKNLSIGKYRIPDFIVTSPGNTPRRSKNNGNTLVSGGPDPSWLIGDIKLSLKTMDNDYVNGKKKPQWNAITRYAGRNGNNVAGFITLFGEGDKRDYYIQRITKKALETIVPGRNGKLAIIALVATIAPSAKSPFTKGK
jgi:RHS repeat-associated protein